MNLFIRVSRLSLFALSMSVSLYSHAAHAAKVKICHTPPNKPTHVISVSQSALPEHLVHGDGIVGIDVNESCQLLSLAYCVFGLYPPYDDELHDVQYFPSTGAVEGQGFTFAGPLVGIITPAGPPASSIFAPGSTYEFVFQYDGLEDYQWSSMATSADDSGVFTGTWQYDPIAIVDNSGPAEYYFLEGACSCDIPGYAGPCPEE